MSLLLLHPDLPFLSNLHIIVLQPYQVLPVPPVRRQHAIVQAWPEPEGQVLINVPVRLPVNNQVLQPTPLDVTNWLNDVFEVFQVLDILGEMMLG